LVQRYLDGWVGAAEASRVAQHLAVCRRCAREAGAYRAIKRVLSGRRDPVDELALLRLRQFAMGTTAAGPPPRSRG